MLVHAAYEQPIRFNFISPHTPSEEDVKREPFPKNISMMVILRNLYTKLEQEETELRTRKETMAKKLGIEVATPVSPVEPEVTPTKTDDESTPDIEENKAVDQKDTKTQPKQSGIKIKPGVYRFSLQDHLWYKDIETGLTRMDEPPVLFTDIGGLGEVKGSW